MKRRSGSLVKDVFLFYLPLLLMLLVLIFPFYWTIVTSLKPQEELYGAVASYWPRHPTLDSYRNLFTQIDFLKPMKNSLIVAVSTVVLSLSVSMLASYAFSRFRFRGRKTLMMLFLTNNMFPTVLLLIPLYAIMRKIGLLFTPGALVLAYTTLTIPFCVWLLNGYFRDIPMALEEAALVDGCNRRQAFFKILLPVFAPCLIATGVYIFMTAWNEYTFAVLFTNENSRTISVSLKNLVSELGVQWDLLTAGGVITIFPICVMFFFAQKRLVEGLTAGAVKG